MSRPFRLGLFIIVALTIFGAGVFLIGKRQFLLTRTYRLTTTFHSVAGLISGAEVHVGGVNRGTVTSIDLPHEPGGQVTVVMKMDRATQDVLRQDSVASIATDGLLGDKHIDVAFGSADAPRVSNGDQIPGEETTDLSDLVSQTGTVMGTLQETAAQLKDIGTKINAGQGTMGSLVNDRRLYDQLTAAAGGLQDNMDALRHNFLLSGFFKSRGYGDSADLTRHAISVLPKSAPAETIPINSTKLFSAPDSAKLKDTKALDGAGRALAGNTFGLAVVVARGGQTGDSDELQVMAQARAMNVRDFLVSHYPMDDTRVKTFTVPKPADASDAGTIQVLIFPARSITPAAKRGR